MWDKMTKFNVQNIVAVLAVLLCFSLAFIVAYRQVPQSSELIINKVIDVTLMGVIGWLFTQSKNHNNKQL